MEKQDAERIITDYVKPIYGFTLKRCKTMEDAEDLSQEIILKAFRVLLLKKDIEDVGKFIWTIAHNALSNYYREAGKFSIGAPIGELTEDIPDGKTDILGDLVNQEEVEKLQSEIAYLSKLQRRIAIAYYYENKKQEEIAKELDLPVGTVKWHLFELKKDLKRGMEIMRTASELKFNPIKFAMCGTNGMEGTKGSNWNFFRSSLAQNIAYVVWKEAKTINEIAEALGVSPVYVESEAEYLEEYGFLIKRGEKYLTNTEITILMQLAITFGNSAKNEYYEVLREYYEWMETRHTISEQFGMYGFVMSGVASYLGDRGEFSDSNKISKNLVEESLYTRGLDYVERNLYSMMWNKKEQQGFDEQNPEWRNCLETCIDINFYTKDEFMTEWLRKKLG